MITHSIIPDRFGFSFGCRFFDHLAGLVDGQINLSQ